MPHPIASNDLLEMLARVQDVDKEVVLLLVMHADGTSAIVTSEDLAAPCVPETETQAEAAEPTPEPPALTFRATAAKPPKIRIPR